MRYLLDTNVLILTAQGKIPKYVAERLEDYGNQIYYSVAALWELSIKYQSGKLKLPISPWEFEQGLIENGYRAIDIKSSHVNLLPDLKSIHTDPFDRIMVAQAIVEKLTLLTTDELLKDYSQQIEIVS